MRNRTIFLLFITILLTVFVMQNNQPARFTFFFAEAEASKMAVMIAVVILSFILGMLVGRQGKIKKELDHFDAEDDRRSALSEEDKDYIN